MAANPCSCLSLNCLLFHHLTQILIIHPRSTHCIFKVNPSQRAFLFAILHHQPSQHHKLTADSYFFLPTCSLLTSAATTGSIFCRYPFSFLFYFTSHNYSTTIIRCGFPSANANLVILLITQKLNYSSYHPI